MGVVVYLDTILVPLSIFLSLGYHACLWQSFKKNPRSCTVGNNALRRTAWFQEIKQGGEKKGMLAVQSIRNTLMTSILSATIAILLDVALAALMNNTYSANRLFDSPVFGSQSVRILILKFGSASLLLQASFLCSSMAVGYLIDANLLVNACGEFSSPGYTDAVFERGFMLALIGNRLLCITFPLFLWMVGPVLVALSSVALVWVLYEIDFPGKLTRQQEFDDFMTKNRT